MSIPVIKETRSITFKNIDETDGLKDEKVHKYVLNTIIPSSPATTLGTFSSRSSSRCLDTPNSRSSSRMDTISYEGSDLDIMSETFHKTASLFQSHFNIPGLTNHELNDIRNFISDHYSNTKEHTLIFPQESGLSRTLEFDHGEVFVLLNREKLGDKKGIGTDKHVSKAICLNDGSISASASFSEKRNSYKTLKELKAAIQEEISLLRDFAGDDRFIQLESYIQYEKDGLFKARMRMPHFESDLLKLMNDDSHLTRADKEDIAFQIISIVDAAHKNGYLMRDLKPENFLVTRQNRKYKVVCCDLGAFCKKTDRNALSEIIGTLEYQSPEYLKTVFIDYVDPTDVTTEKHDVWAMGKTLASLLGMPQTELLDGAISTSQKKTAKKLSSLELDEPPTHTLEHIVWLMLQTNPEERISSKDALIFAEIIKSL